MDNKQQDQQLAAVLASLGIFGFALAYWVIQIQDVCEMLAMAYG
jgi:hypothetical protein